MYIKDVITAIATPPGIGAISIIRISGDNLKSIYIKLTKKQEIVDRRASYLPVYGKNGNIIDTCMVIYIKGPNSYTGEDIIEINSHGGNLVPQLILSEILLLPNVRMADRGEFSRRAFLNNKIDLMQAESIAALIESESNDIKNVNLKNTLGFISSKISSINKNLLSVLTVVEHELDFNEDEITHITKVELDKKLKNIYNNLMGIVESSLYTKKLKDGYTVVICGKPNVGKSSLFNHLVGTSRTIVSNKAGTTRDAIEEQFTLNGIKIRLIDTAGYMETDNYIDKESVKKTKDAINGADLLLILDENDPQNELEKINLNNQKYILISTKFDLKKSVKKGQSYINVSSVDSTGINILINKISTLLSTSIVYDYNKDPMITSNRQKKIINQSIKYINRAINMLAKGEDMAVVSSLLRMSCDLLSELTGVIYTDDILDKIFTGFCVGK